MLEDVLFSMMAHISYDLPVALRRMAPVATHVADFHRMNDVLGVAIEGVQDGLAERYSRGLAVLDKVFARQDELLSNYGIRVARGLAWFNADRLLDPAGLVRGTGVHPPERRGVHPRDPLARRLAPAPRAGDRRFLVPERRRWPESPGSGPPAEQTRVARAASISDELLWLAAPTRVHVLSEEVGLQQGPCAAVLRDIRVGLGTPYCDHLRVLEVPTKEEGGRSFVERNQHGRVAVPVLDADGHGAIRNTRARRETRRFAVVLGPGNNRVR